MIFVLSMEGKMHQEIISPTGSEDLVRGDSLSLHGGVDSKGRVIAEKPENQSRLIQSDNSPDYDWFQLPE